MKKWYTLAILAGLVAGLFHDAHADDDWSISLTLATYHYDRSYDCHGAQVPYNESNPGIILGYKYLRIGRYENSHSNCGDIKYSNLIGLEYPLGELGLVEFSIAGAIADGYPDENEQPNDWMPIVSLNAQIGVVKAMLSTRAIGLALSWSF